MSGTSGGAAPAHFRVPVLCYHALRAGGEGYRGNDHVALAHDLQTLRGAGYRLLPLIDLVRAVRGRAALPHGRLACITFDDAPDCERFDSPHAEGLAGQGFHTTLRQFRERHPESLVDAAAPLAVSFVIASDAARTVLDAACIAGRGEWRSAWWAECAREGLVELGNHSWDHLHAALPTVAQQAQRKGSFDHVRTPADAAVQVRQAREAVERASGAPCRFSAYPYGHAPRYLRRRYLPREPHGHLAAFGTGGWPVGAATDIWRLPRFVSGQHWTTPEGFAELLARSRDPGRGYWRERLADAVPGHWKQLMRRVAGR